MTPKKIFWLLAIVGISLVSSGVILAQRADHVPRTKVVSFNGDRPWMGVHLKDVTPEKARELKLPGDYGAIVTKVEPDSPAAKAGLAANDVILEFAGERVRGVAQLGRLVRETPPGRAVNLEVSRDGQQRTFTVKLESHGEEFYASARCGSRKKADGPQDRDSSPRPWIRFRIFRVRTVAITLGGRCR